MNKKLFGLSRISPIGPIAFLLILAVYTACGGSSTVSNSEPPTSTPAPAAPLASPTDSLEEALRYVRNGQYTYIWVFSRKDGKPLDSEDGAFLRTNAPQVVDWVKADAESRKVVGGTNFNLEEGNLEALRKRFNMEDYSGK